MSSRCLSEIAYSTYYVPGFEIPEEVVDQALIEVGIDPTNDAERVRFMNLVKASRELRLQDQLASLGRFADEARLECGEDADLDELIQCAIEFKQQSED